MDRQEDWLDPNHCKADKDGRCFDWQSVKTIYNAVRCISIECYPTEGPATDSSHTDAAGKFMKERINSKIKIRCHKCHVAIDSDSGGGWVDAQVYGKCLELWGSRHMQEHRVSWAKCSVSRILGKSIRKQWSNCWRWGTCFESTSLVHQ